MAKISDKNKKLIGFGLAILILALIIYLNKDKPAVANVLDKFKKAPAPVITNTLTTGVNTKNTPTTTDSSFNIKDAEPVKNDEFPLHIGSYGERVKSLQLALNRINDKASHRYTPLVVDKDFGEKTYTAIVTWVGSKFWEPQGLTATNFNLIIQQSNA